MAHASGKGAYIEETWAPHYLPSPLVLTPAGYLAASLDQQAAVGAANPDFAQMDVNWIHAITRFAAANKMESVGPFTTQTFFSYGSANNDKVNDSTYVQNMFNAVQKGQLTPTGQAFLSDSQKLGIKQAVNISNASYPTLPTVFNPNCGSASNPCNPNAAVAADMLVSAFGADLATTTLLDGSFPTNLGGTTVTLVDASNTSLSAPIFSVSPTQVNYYVPASVQPGPVTVTVTSADGTVTTGTVLVLPVAPGIYTANENGKGVPAAIAVCAGTCAGWPSAGHVNGQYFQTTFTPGCAPGNCEPQTINLGGPDDNVVLELYGTGWRHLASLGAITAQINGQTLPPVQYAGKSSYTGLDQLNVPLPRSLAGSGQVNLVLTVRDSGDNLTLTSNAVTLAF
jgi:uncharacterized protein (TIGR03437 family)